MPKAAFSPWMRAIAPARRWPDDGWCRVGRRRAKRKGARWASSATPRMQRRISSAVSRGSARCRMPDRLCRLDLARPRLFHETSPQPMTVRSTISQGDLGLLEVCRRFPTAAKSLSPLDTIGRHRGPIGVVLPLERFARPIRGYKRGNYAIWSAPACPRRSSICAPVSTAPVSRREDVAHRASVGEVRVMRPAHA
jgi:hypothetical protein